MDMIEKVAKAISDATEFTGGGNWHAYEAPARAAIEAMYDEAKRQRDEAELTLSAWEAYRDFFEDALSATLSLISRSP